MADHIDVTSLLSLGAINSVDFHLTQLMERLTAEDTPPDALLAMALASQWPQRGHICLDLTTLTADDLWNAQEYTPTLPSLELPDLESWLAALSRSPAVGGADDTTPFVLWQDRWLYLRRFWDYEREVAHRLHHWLLEDPKPASEHAPTTAKLFGREAIDETDLQQKATLLAAQHPCLILTGGPGTGKTTTVLRILALLLSLDPELDVSLAAPTGKAALRLQESISAGLTDLPCDDAIKTKIPTSAQTLHRLLGYQRHKTTFRHGPTNPLPHDLVVVDEASMMDLGLFAKLLRALRPESRLILVGDREQLPSVDAGAVFAVLCTEMSPIPRVELTRNYRFSQDRGIGALASGIKAGDADMTEAVLSDGTDSSCGLEPLPAPNQMRESLWLALEEFLKGLANVMEPEEAFAQLNRLRVLCAHRTGPFGAEAVNELVHDLLVTRLRQPRQQRWFPGRPILITENDYAVELFNGDTGMILPWNGKLHAFFQDGDAGFRHVPPARLPAHESAYAMTVHKSQGSEFDEVLLLLTDQPSRLLTRELLYTGVTRARSRVRVWSPPQSLRACVDNPLVRTSGLHAWFQTWDDLKSMP